MATAKRARHEKGFYRSVERGTAIKAERIRPKQEKVKKDKLYPIEVSTCPNFVYSEVSLHSHLNINIHIS